MSSNRKIFTAAFTTFLLAWSAVSADPAQASVQDEKARIHHEITITLSPDEHLLEATDAVTFPPGFPAAGAAVFFTLHRNLEVTCSTKGVELVAAETPEGLHSRYELRPAAGTAFPQIASLAYRGAIHHPVEQTGEEYARAFSETPGIIDAAGVYLAASSGWYPGFGEEMVTFSADVSLPDGWDAVSQGSRSRHETADGRRRLVWTCALPQDGITLTAGRYTEYSRKCGDVTAFAFLQKPDPALAAKYLQATEGYIDLYTDLIGPYAYDKFALVENFWETGYGMPSFTLLGPKVIRFPFILTSSYPHEILHNWWGNGVFVAPGAGNWCEGLTAYLADHLMKEQQGKGAEHRRAVLQKYADYVRDGKDFPLTEFRSRHDAVTETVGYGKCLMLFHMLRCRIGDEAFKQGLRAFYEKHLFEYATFDDVEAAFSAASGEDLKPFFSQWVERTGAPRITIDDGGAFPIEGDSGKYRLVLITGQKQEEEPFDIRIPLAVHIEGETEATFFLIETKFRRSQAEIDLPGKPLRIELDPRFELFRRLHPQETPPSIGGMFGADKVLIVLPAAATGEMAAAWTDLAAAWSSDAEKVTVVRDDELESLPLDSAVWIFGRENKFCPVDHSDLKRYEVVIGTESVEFGLQDSDLEFSLGGHAFAVTMRHNKLESLPLCWVGASLPESLAGLGRKLPHYGKYSYLVFEGGEPTNVAKGQWPPLENPMVVNLDKRGAPGSVVPQRDPLVAAQKPFTEDGLKRLADFLADDRLAGRGLGTAELDAAAVYIAEAFEKVGLQPAGDDGTFMQTWTEGNGPDGADVTLKNVLARIDGADPALPPLVVGAHYDHLGLGWPDVREGCEGQIHNGADDNASGVAVLLETARVLAKEGFRPNRTVIFAAFTGEEAGLRGSGHFVRTLEGEPSAAVFAMINLDSVGRLEGRKLQILGTGSAKEWPHIVMGVGYTTGVQADAVPADPGGGDQVSFRLAGIPAVHIFGGLHEDYHRPTDDLDKLDLAGMVDAAVLLKEIVLYLGERTEPLQAAGAFTGGHPTASSGKTGRKISLGTMPDFAFAGPGVRVAQIMSGSAAEEAQLAEGDVITRIDEHEIADLKGYSDILKQYSPGDEITVHFVRGEESLSVRAVLRAR